MDTSLLRQDFKSYLQKRFPNDNNISSTVSMAFFLERNGDEFGIDFQRLLVDGNIPDSYRLMLEKHFANNGRKDPRGNASIYVRSLRLLIECFNGHSFTAAPQKSLISIPQRSRQPFYYWIDSTTPRHGDRAFEIAHLDHTKADLETKHSRTAKKLGRFWLTILYDAFTRRVLAFYISFRSPSYISDMMVLRECVRRFGRLPHIIVTDHGKDFKSEYFQSLLANFGIVHKLRPPHKSRFGSVCERYFGIATIELLHNLRGNTKIMKRVRQVTKYVDPKSWAVWTLPLVYELLKEYFYEEYDNAEHSTLGESPKEAFERSMIYSGKRETRYIAYNTFLLMSMPEKKRTGMSKVEGQRGVRVNYFYYNAPELRSYHGEYVPVRYDPWNMGVVYCYVGSRWVKCRSEHPALRNRSEMEIQIASEELHKQTQNSAKNRIIRAQDIAKLLSRATQTEEMLLQRDYDEEMRPQLEALNGGMAKSAETDTYQSDAASTVISDIEFEAIKKSFIINDMDVRQRGSN